MKLKLLAATLLLSGCSTVTHLNGNNKIHDTSDIVKGMTTQQVHKRLGRPGSQIMTVEAWNRYFVEARTSLGGKRAWLYRRTDIYLKKKRVGLIFDNNVLVEKVVRYE